jgi:hypothetical protein
MPTYSEVTISPDLLPALDLSDFLYYSKLLLFL